MSAICPVNPLVQAVSNPQRTLAANLPDSGGFEGMALNASRTRLYTLLEKAIADARIRGGEVEAAGLAYYGIGRGRSAADAWRPAPISSSLERKAARPECLPITRLERTSPTSSGRMIS